MHAPGKQPPAPAVPSKQPVALHQKEFQTPPLRLLRLRLGRRLITESAFLFLPRSPRTEIHLAPASCRARRHRCAHCRMFIRQVKECPRHFHREPLVRIQRIEPHARPALRVVHISPHVQFQKVRNPRYRRQSTRPDPLHEKRHHPHPRPPLVQIHRQPRRQGRLDRRGFPRPM